MKVHGANQQQTWIRGVVEIEASGHHTTLVSSRPLGLPLGLPLGPPASGPFPVLRWMVDLPRQPLSSPPATRDASGVIDQPCRVSCSPQLRPLNPRCDARSSYDGCAWCLIESLLGTKHLLVTHKKR